MPILPIRFALLEQYVDGGRTLLEPLLFPEMSRLGAGTEAAQKALIRNVEQLVKHTDPGLLYKRRVAEELLADEVTLTLAPPKANVAWQREIQLTLPFVHWSTKAAEANAANGGSKANSANGDAAANTTLAYVPALAMHVIVQGRQDIRRQVEHELRSALARRRAETLEAIAPLARYGALKIIRRDGELDVMTTDKWSEYMERFGAPEDKSALKEVASNLAKSPLPAAYETGEQVERFARLLSATKMPHVLLIGPSGVGKSALYYELVRRRRDFEFAGREFWETSGARLVAGMSGFGMWQERCQRLLAETAKRNVVLHLGNLVELMEVGKSADSNQSIAAFLRNALYRGELTAVAECTEAQLDVIERADPQLLAAFQPLRLQTPDTQHLQSILLSAAVEPPPERKLKKRKRKNAKKEERRRVASMRPVSPEAIAMIERLHSRFATYSAAPGRPLRFLRNMLQSGPSYLPIDESEVTRSFAKETGLPEFILDDQQPMRVADVRDWFGTRIIGQSDAVDVIVNLLATIKAGLNRPTRPFASMIFVGPTGVGKTELAKSLARFLYRDERRLVRFDMSEFADPVAVDRLIGGSFASEGLLTRKVREQPFTVVLLDEIEKAYSSFFDLLLQVLGEGRLTDSSGRVADFRNSVIIMTSNLGAEAFRGRRLGLSDDSTQSVDAETYFIRKVREFVRPELFNRIDRIVPFRALVGEQEIRWIADREIEKLRKRDGIQYRDLDLTFSDRAIAALANEGVEPTLGARPLKRVLERRVTAPLATKLNAHSANHGYVVGVDVEQGAVVLDAKAKPKQADRQGVDVHTAILQLSKTRRRTQQLARGSASLRLQNEQFRLRQRYEQLLRRTKKRPKPGNPETSASDWVNFPDAGRLAMLDAVIERFQRLEKESAEFEEQAMVEYYSERPQEAKQLETHTDEFEKEIQSILAKIFQLDSQRVTEVTLCVFSESKPRMLEMIQAYESYARVRQWLIKSRNLFRQYDPEIDSESPRFNNDKYRQTPRPALRLHASMEVEEEQNDEEEEKKKPPKVLDVFRTQKFSQPAANVVGMALVVRGEAAHPLLEPEHGLHEFKDRSGRQDACVVETSAGRLSGYSPPLDVCRRSFLTRASKRRRYLFVDGVAEDSLLKTNLKVDGGSLKDAVKIAIDAYFAKQLELLLHD